MPGSTVMPPDAVRGAEPVRERGPTAPAPRPVGSGPDKYSLTFFLDRPKLKLSVLYTALNTG